MMPCGLEGAACRNWMSSTEDFVIPAKAFRQKKPSLLAQTTSVRIFFVLHDCHAALAWMVILLVAYRNTCS